MNIQSKLRLLTICLSISPILLHAQTKKILALGNTANPARLSAGDVSLYENAALAGIRRTNLCQVMERKEWENILKERGIQKTEEFMNGQIVPQSQSLGAEYLLIITLQSWAVKDDKSKSSGDWYRDVETIVILDAKIVSVETGEAVYNKAITVKESESYSKDDASYRSSKDEIINTFKSSLANQCDFQFSLFMYEVFPPEIEIIKVEETKKQKAKTVLCKTSAILPVGAKLEVYSEENFDTGSGEILKRKKDIGKLKIEKIEGEKLILCDVLDGGEDILKNVQTKTKMKCKPNFERGFFDLSKKPKF